MSLDGSESSQLQINQGSVGQNLSTWIFARVDSDLAK
jgi:hypothetical protein